MITRTLCWCSLLFCLGCSFDPLDAQVVIKDKPLPEVNEESMLTVKETLGLFFVHPRGERPDLYLYANPKAKPYIYKMLNNKTIQSSYNVERMLSIIYSKSVADENDFKYIQQEIIEVQKTKKDLVNLNETCRIHSLFESLSELCKQQVKGSESLRKSILDIKFWRNTQFRFEHRKDSVEAEMATMMIFLYQWPNKKMLSEDLRKIAHDFKGHKDEKYMNMVIQKKKESFTPPTKKVIKKRPVATYTNDVMNELTWSYKDYLYWKNKAAAAFNGDLKNPGPAKQSQKNGNQEMPSKTEIKSVQKSPKHAISDRSVFDWNYFHGSRQCKKFAITTKGNSTRACKKG